MFCFCSELLLGNPQLSTAAGKIDYEGVFSVKVTDEENLSESKSEDHFYSKMKSLGLAIVEKQTIITYNRQLIENAQNIHMGS